MSREGCGTEEDFRDKVVRLAAKQIRIPWEEKGKKVVAVLGSFDTWPYIDQVCREVARLGHYAVTSVRLYFLDNGNVEFRRRGEPFKTLKMRDSLRQMVFDEAHSAIIIYSVPGAHYIETEWCFERMGRDQDFECYGITFVREIRDGNNCQHLKPIPNLEGTKCAAGSDRTAWECIQGRKLICKDKHDERPFKIEEFCPFKKQEVAKNVIEYFFGERMGLFALEGIATIHSLLPSLLQ